MPCSLRICQKLKYQIFRKITKVLGGGHTLRYYPPQITFFVKYASYEILNGTIWWGRVSRKKKYKKNFCARLMLARGRIFMPILAHFPANDFSETVIRIDLKFSGIIDGKNAQGLNLKYWCLDKNFDFYCFFFIFFSQI